MKVLLILPPSYSIIKALVGTSWAPLGLGYLASVLKEEHEVGLIDCVVNDMSFEDLRPEIKRFDPDIAGVTATTSTIHDAYKTAVILKEINPNCLVILGGAHATVMAHEILEECPQIDVIVRGEGEVTIQELLSVINDVEMYSEVRGITYRYNGSIKGGKKWERC